MPIKCGTRGLARRSDEYRLDRATGMTVAELDGLRAARGPAVDLAFVPVPADQVGDGRRSFIGCSLTGVSATRTRGPIQSSLTLVPSLC
jgi:hypothetical protein